MLLVCLSVLSVCLCLSVCLVCLSVCLSVCLPLHRYRFARSEQRPPPPPSGGGFDYPDRVSRSTSTTRGTLNSGMGYYPKVGHFRQYNQYIADDI